MQVGVAFPITEIGSDPAIIRDFAQAADELGYSHLTCIDHVVGAARAEAEWRAYYTRENMFHEVLVLFGFLAAVTRKIQLNTAILILPQRQTALVAKQAAEIDVLSGGRLVLGVGLGWNEIEFEALNENFRNRARRMEEQIELLRLMWTQELLTYKGRFHTITDVGLNPLPRQRPIPIWIGAFEKPAIERAARLADGWYVNPRLAPGNEAAILIAAFRDAAAMAGRDISKLAIDATIHVGSKTPEQLRAEASQWRALGATRVTVRTIYAGLPSPQAHIEAIRRILPAVGAP